MLQIESSKKKGRVLRMGPLSVAAGDFCIACPFFLSKFPDVPTFLGPVPSTRIDLPER